MTVQGPMQAGGQMGHQEQMDFPMQGHYSQQGQMPQGQRQMRSQMSAQGQMMQEEGLQKAIKNYGRVAVVDGVLGIGLLVCGGLSAKYSADTFRTPYYVGGFVVGVLALVHALLCRQIVVKGPDSQSDDTKQRKVIHMIIGQGCLAVLTLIGCFVGMMFLGIYGYVSNDNIFDNIKDNAIDEYQEQNIMLSIVILVCCILVSVMNVLTLRMVCTYGAYFGMVRNNISNRDATSNGITLRTEQLRSQNALPHQQILLQQQLAQQQQQNRFSQGVYMSPPPSYEDVVNKPDVVKPPVFSLTPNAPQR